MAKIEVAIRDAIARGSRKQVRQVAGPVRREVRKLRQTVRQLRTEVSALKAVAAQWQRATRGRPWQPEVSERESKEARLSPRLIRKLRTRLALSQARVARLLGVSPAAVVQWEQGRSTPSDQNRRALVALRKLGRREVKQVLATLPEPAPAKTRRPSRRRGATIRRGRRSRPGRKTKT